MVKADRWIGLFFALFSLYICVESVRLGLGTYQRPGPGFVPFCAGTILGVLSLAPMFVALFGRTQTQEPWHNRGQILMVFLSMLVFTLLIEWLGFVFFPF